MHLKHDAQRKQPIRAEGQRDEARSRDARQGMRPTTDPAATQRTYDSAAREWTVRFYSRAGAAYNLGDVPQLEPLAAALVPNSTALSVTTLAQGVTPAAARLTAAQSTAAAGVTLNVSAAATLTETLGDWARRQGTSADVQNVNSARERVAYAYLTVLTICTNL